jgi:hypothetical protein
LNRPVDKSALRQAILAKLEAELALQAQAADASRSEATDTDSRAEGKFDMRGQSAAYLAAGQSKLAEEIAGAVATYRALPLRAFASNEAIAVGAVVTLQSRGRDHFYFLGPARGGLEVEVDGTPVTVITAASFLGRSLLGQRHGFTISLPGRGLPVTHFVAAVA